MRRTASGFAVGFVGLALLGCGGGNDNLPPVQSSPDDPAVQAGTSDPGSATVSPPPAPELSALSQLDPSEWAVLDPRRTRLQQRVLALLITEIQHLESLFKSTELGSSSRPMVLRRLAEDYVELEFAALREKQGAEAKRDSLKQTDPREAGKQQAIANSRKTTMDRSRKAAIANYTLLVEDYSGQPSSRFATNPPPAYAALDEARYYLALEYCAQGDAANGRRVLLDVITKSPSSKYVPRAYMLFGELFAAEGSGDPSKYTPAEQAFSKAASGSNDPDVTRVALARLAAVARLAGDTSAANQAQARLDSAPASTSAAPAPPTATTPAPTPFAPAAPPPAIAVAPAPAPVAGPALIAASPQPASFALIVGIEHYRDVPAATGARTDADRFAQLARQTLGLRDDHVRVAVEDHATRTDILEGLKWLHDTVTAGSRIYFFFSGHGAPSPDSSTYLLPYDGNAKDIPGTALAMADVMRQLGQTRAREVLGVVDSCFSGAGGRSILPPGARPLMRVKDPSPTAQMAVFTASQGDEISGPAPGENAGVFTKYVTTGLGTGAADVNGDGQISLQELSDWVTPRVARAAKQDNRDQHPKLVVGSGVGDPGNFIVEYGLSTR